MHPILFTIGTLEIRVYGVLTAIAFMTGIYLSSILAKKRSINPDIILDLGLVIIICSIIGARALYVIVWWKYFAVHLAEIFKVWEGGLVFYGGLIGVYGTFVYNSIANAWTTAIGISTAGRVTAASTVGGVITGSSSSVTGAQTAASTVGGVITGSSASVTGSVTAASTVGGVITGSSASVTGTVTAASTVGGVITGSSASVTGTVTGASLAGTITTASQTNITSVGSLGSTQISSLGVGTGASGVSGEIRAIDNITAYYSDARLKDFLGTIPNALDKVLSLNGYYFTENAKAKELGYNNEARQVGVSAQEVEAVLPEIVVDAPINSNFSGADYKTVHYEKLVPLLIEAIKEQQKQIDELKNK